MHKSSIENQGNLAKPMLGDVVNYSDVIDELKYFNLNEEFEKLFNDNTNKELAIVIKRKPFICKNATSSLVRFVLSIIGKETLLYEKWLFVFQYFLALPFERNENKLFNYLKLIK